MPLVDSSALGLGVRVPDARVCAPRCFPLMHSEYSAAVGEQPTERLTVVSCCLACGGLSAVPRALVLGFCRFLDMKLGQQTR